MADYDQIPAGQVPGGIVWVTPARSQGQTVETSYSRGIPGARLVNYDAADGDAYRRVTDHSGGTVTYYRLAR